MIFRKKLVFVIIIQLFVRKLQAQYPSVPCPEIFQYFRFGPGEDDVGIVTIKIMDYGEYTLEIKLSQPEKIESKYLGDIALGFHHAKAADNIASGTPFSYIVNFPLKNVIPKVRAIKFNGADICPVSEVPQGETIINLKNTINVERPKKINIMTTTQKPLETTTINSKPMERFDFLQRSTEWRPIDLVCGHENSEQSVKKLIVSGARLRKSRFPWIAALYLKNPRGLFFQCGGSLITTRTVISAAHCFYLYNNTIIKDERILVSMGRHNLDEWSNSDIIFNSDVEKIIRHPDYRPELDNNDADIAIVLLKEPVTFTFHIRPVCIWDGTLDVDEIEGIAGMVVGWGRDEKNNIVTRAPKLASAKIVSELSCLKSNPRFIHHSSNRTLCAGNRDGSGPCTGDSGSGLMIQVNNIWKLRGIVSIALDSESEIHGCDLKEYVLYTDIAQFLGWIYDNSKF